jgi:hypothetical protein
METDEKTHKNRRFIQNAKGGTRPILVTHFSVVLDQPERDAASHIMLLKAYKESYSMTGESKPCYLRITTHDKHHEANPRICECRLKRSVVAELIQSPSTAEHSGSQLRQIGCARSGILNDGPGLIRKTSIGQDIREQR